MLKRDYLSFCSNYSGHASLTLINLLTNNLMQSVRFLPQGHLQDRVVCGFSVPLEKAVLSCLKSKRGNGSLYLLYCKITAVHNLKCNYINIDLYEYIYIASTIKHFRPCAVLGKQGILFGQQPHPVLDTFPRTTIPAVPVFLPCSVDAYTVCHCFICTTHVCPAPGLSLCL